jgi:predicted P-loop ATPase
VAEEIRGDILDPDMILAEYEDWTDMSSWPVSNGKKFSGKEEVSKAQDPYKKSGFLGAFCRAYPMEEAIGTFMSDVYAPSVVPGRFDYIPADSSAGVVVYEGKYMYSHHATDPLCGRLLNAFDMVRLHKFGHLDRDLTDGFSGKAPSYRAMIDFIRDNERVRQEILNGKAEEARADFSAPPAMKGDGNGNTTCKVNSHSPSTTKGELSRRLKFRSDGTLDNCLTNFLTILELDDRLSAIRYNLLKDSVDVQGELPWKRVKQGWSDADMAQLNAYLSKHYDIYGPLKSKDALISMASERQFHPIREYFASLPAWDGVKRVETLLVEYLGADDNAYTRAVTRKTLAAAVARIYRPGTKFDSVLILNGPQGIGKSTLFEKLGKEWFSDSLTLTDMRDKAAAEKLQGYFLLELGELAGMKKADIETVKSFLSRTDDKYRASYGINVESHPRQCVIVGTTNAENGFLRDVTGNRRFWPVPVTGMSPKKPWDLTEEVISQIWAEAIAIHKGKEPLYLESELLGTARIMQQRALESDDREGLVRKYLETKLPLNWDTMDLPARRMYLAGETLGSQPQGTVRRKTVTNIEIFVECFGRNSADLRKQDSYDITAIMSKYGDWKKSNSRLSTPYGRQRFYELVEAEEDA